MSLAVVEFTRSFDLSHYLRIIRFVLAFGFLGIWIWRGCHVLSFPFSLPAPAATFGLGLVLHT